MSVSNLSTGLRPGICLSSSRPTVPYIGQTIFETDTAKLLIWDGANWAGEQQSFTIALGDEVSSITTGTAKVTIRAPFAMKLFKIPRAYLSTTSSSGNPTVDIKVNTVSIFSTQLSINATQKTSTTASTAAVLSSTSIADDAEITFDITTAGTGAKGLKVVFFYRML
jgi:hypothetical protein